jgi:hypothetical protein
MKNLFYLFVLISVITACSNPKPTNNQKPKITPSINDTSFLADKNFAFKNLQDISTLWNNHKYGDDNKLFSDSTYRIALVPLTRQQKEKIIAPFLLKELSIDNVNYIVQGMQAYFISKQNKIGTVQPILVMITGDDYTSLTMILLDKNNHSVNGFNLFGGMQPGPTEKGDSLLIIPLDRYSVIAGNVITSYEVTHTDYSDSLKRPTLVDSVVLKSVIGDAGKIITTVLRKGHSTIPYHKGN